jgi:YidC/Oxa1 family membrane protein insertase
MNTELRFVVAILLMVAVLVVTNLLFPPTPPALSGPGMLDTVSVPQGGPPRSTGGAPRQVLGGPDPLPSVPGTPATPTDVREREVAVVGPLYRHIFSTRGARLISAELLAFRSFTRDGPVQLIPAGGDGALGLRLVLGADTLDLRNFPFTPSRERVTLGERGSERLTFRHQVPGLVVEVSYLFVPDSYLIEVTGSVRGLDRALLLIDLGSGLALNDADPKSEERALAYVGNHLQDGVSSHPLSKVEGAVVYDGPFLWAAFKSKFFVLAMQPGADGVGPEQFGGMLVWPEGSDRALVAVSEPIAGEGEFGYRTFIGPQEYARLTALGGDLDEVNPYGWRLFRPVIRPLVGVITGLLVFMHDTLNLAYGWVLILFGVLMRGVLWPFNQKAMRAQMRNMAVQPMLKEIQTKYKDNPEKLQKEMLRLYKEYGFNPMAGCLPMLLPWPVLISLFFVFQNTIEFRGASFLWISDLSAPDPIFILPVFLGISMFFLQRISMRSMPPNPQMKMMMWIMPIMMVFIFFNLAAGLNLYYSVANIATIPQQWLIAKERQKTQALGPVKKSVA